jgi:hypothetical protein
MKQCFVIAFTFGLSKNPKDLPEKVYFMAGGGPDDYSYNPAQGERFVTYEAAQQAIEAGCQDKFDFFPDIVDCCFQIEKIFVH